MDERRRLKLEAIISVLRSQTGFTGNLSTLFKQLVAKLKPDETKYLIIIREKRMFAIDFWVVFGFLQNLIFLQYSYFSSFKATFEASKLRLFTKELFEFYLLTISTSNCTRIFLHIFKAEKLLFLWSVTL